MSVPRASSPIAARQAPARTRAATTVAISTCSAGPVRSDRATPSVDSLSDPTAVASGNPAANVAATSARRVRSRSVPSAISTAAPTTSAMKPPREYVSPMTRTSTITPTSAAMRARRPRQGSAARRSSGSAPVAHTSASAFQ